MTDTGTASASDATRISHRRALSYIDVSRRYYEAHGYTTPYQWAAHDDAPFHRPDGDLADATVAVVTTAFPHGHTRPKQVMAVPSDPVPSSLFTADLSWHKEATHTDDIDTFLPLHALERAHDRIGAVSERFYAVPTSHSQRASRMDAERVAEWCDQDGVDVVLLVPL